MDGLDWTWMSNNNKLFPFFVSFSQTSVKKKKNGLLMAKKYLDQLLSVQAPKSCSKYTTFAFSDCLSFSLSPSLLSSYICLSVCLFLCLFFLIFHLCLSFFPLCRSACLPAGFSFAIFLCPPSLSLSLFSL